MDAYEPVLLWVHIPVPKPQDFFAMYDCTLKLKVVKDMKSQAPELCPHPPN